MSRSLVLGITLGYAAAASVTWANELRGVLDSTGAMHGTGDYPQEDYDSLVSCMNKADPGLLNSQDKAWAGFFEYFRMGGGPGDEWGGDPGQWVEQNKTSLPAPGGDVDIFEPCNFASNFAYYHAAIEVCGKEDWAFRQSEADALVQAFSGLAWGSAFMHGSWTRLGANADNRMIDVVAYVTYQGAVDSLPCSGEQCNILRGLSTAPRRYTGVDVAGILTETFATTRVETWDNAITDTMSDVPDYFLIFAGIVSNWLHYLLPPDAVDQIVNVLGNLFGIPEEFIEFIERTYLPTLRDVTQGIELSEEEKDELTSVGFAALIKLVFSFLYQEEFFDIDFFKTPLGNQLGAQWLPQVNELANGISGNEYFNPRIQRCENTYPGDTRCRRQQPHSKWHESSSTGLFDLVLAANAVKSVTSRKLAELRGETPEPFVPQKKKTEPEPASKKPNPLPKDRAGELRTALDSAGQMLNVGDFDQEQYETLVACMNKADPGLFESSEKGWAGFFDFGVAGKIPETGDEWGSYYPGYVEQNPTTLPAPAPPVTIYEPCNYASNIAYYWSAIEMCGQENLAMSEREFNALIQGFTGLAWGSSFMHGGWNKLGFVADNRLIDVVSYVAYQAAIENIPCSGDQCNIIRGLSIAPRRYTGVDVAGMLTRTFATTGVETWEYAILDIMSDIPDYYLTFAGIVSHWMHWVFPEDQVDAVIDVLAELLGLPEEFKEFILRVYLPTVRDVTRGIELSEEEKQHFMDVGFAAGIKLLYSFLWQETFFPNEFFFSVIGNRLGAQLLPLVNNFANELSGNTYAFPDVQNCQNVYPGDQRCRNQQPHSKWHESAATGLTDLVLAADELRRLTAGKFEKVEEVRTAVE